MKKLLLLPFFLIHVLLFSQPINIVPAPAEIKITEGANFAITKSTVIFLEGSGLENTANFFNDYLQQLYGLKLKISKKEVEKNSIVLNYERADNPIPGAYTLAVNNKGVYIAGDNEQGVFYGIHFSIRFH